MRYFVAKGESRRLDSAIRAGLRGEFICLSDGVTHYELTGPADGDLVLLVGGLTVPLAYWDHTAAALHKAGLRTLAYSAYGRGYSDRVRLTYDDALFVRQLAELKAALGLSGRHHVLGSSMGALVAMQHAALEPEAVATLTLAGPAGLGEKPAALRLLLSGDRRARFVARYFGRRWLDTHESRNLGDRSNEAELTAMLGDAFQCEGSLHALFDTLQNFALFDRADLYRATRNLPVPTMLLWGRDDQVTPISRLDAVRALLRPDECHILECGHMTPFERPDQVAALILAFARSFQSRSNS